MFLVAAAPAAADSIVFVRDGDVWISTPDGTTERQLTAGGGWTSPSMADDGTIVALRGGDVRAAAPRRRGGRRAGRRRSAGNWLVAAARTTRACRPTG